MQADFHMTKLCLVTRFLEVLLPVTIREAKSRRAGMCSQAERGNKVEEMGRQECLPLMPLFPKGGPDILVWRAWDRSSTGYQSALSCPMMSSTL
jgi:hypothetical protein